MEMKTVGDVLTHEMLGRVYDALPSKGPGTTRWVETWGELGYDRNILALFARAVAAHVRAEDAARGGTLSAEEFGKIEDRFVAGEATNEDVGAMLNHAAAQGRTIAGLERYRDNLCEQHQAMMEERDEARADLAKAQSSVSNLRGLCNNLETRAAESDLATLRRAVEREVTRLAQAGKAHPNIIRRLNDALSVTPSEHPDTATLRQAVAEQAENIREGLAAERAKTRPSQARIHELLFAEVALGPILKALSATPSEHPDTATLRRIRERVKALRAGGAADELLAASFAAEPYPSSDTDLVRDVVAEVLRRLLGDSGPGGGGERVAMTHPVDWSKHAKHCTVEFTPGYDTHRTWVCAPDCPSKPTTPPDVAAPTPTPEEDWREAESCADLLASIGDRNRAVRLRAALARLKAEPRRAAEAMRERCAKDADTHWSLGRTCLAARIRDLSLD